MRRHRELRGQLLPARVRLGLALDLDQGAHVVGHRPDVVVGEGALPRGHGRAADARGDRAVEILEGLAGANVVAREVRGHQLVTVVAVFHFRVVGVRAQGRLPLGELHARRADRLFRLVRRVAGKALRHAVIDLHPARDRFGLALGAPRIGARDDRLAGRLFSPLRRKRLDGNNFRL